MEINTKRFIQTTGCLLLSCFLCCMTYGQSKDSVLKKIYLQVAAGGCSNNGVFYELGVQAVLKHNWVTTFSYHGIEADPKNLPSDYREGYTVVVIIPVPDERPYTHLNIFSFTGGKCFEAGRKIWFTTEAGFSIINGEKLSFTEQPEEWDGVHISANYSVKKEKQTTIGGMLKADFNWAFLPFMGLGAGAFANFNSIQSPVGFQVKVICGWMNRKSKH